MAEDTRLTNDLPRSTAEGLSACMTIYSDVKHAKINRFCSVIFPVGINRLA